ncbi:MAG: hypothetical protein AUJ52_06310 [Elusimicrobia bacterium CG1_02_63_36]|nr:MAG: hypothetical protein AUJ52_06310 [Elusimicrobia bacterium CG1_02_63_36]PIP81851.1 MAG: hypothetical protein COR54_17975 [Elusimicrobia bacterium CG22_combo_CG10-13_8_21_14_all_63_91]PJA17549.1 MAG: hypothetical protein COX66_04065 [Elusimicrobia bacterium CG_4_10_14_0_2_um_filter_63_34]PJB26290.1 MAG: hypothetical protein CO113_04250 [Elusimicrobia bacterium CG_4_9_14_3_um_filter_62_55]
MLENTTRKFGSKLQRAELPLVSSRSGRIVDASGPIQATESLHPLCLPVVGAPRVEVPAYFTPNGLARNGTFGFGEFENVAISFGNGLDRFYN